MNKKHNFLKILFSVCSSTKLFPDISKNSAFRTIWHLILISILAAIIFTGARTPEMKSNIKEVTTYLQKEFGGIIVKKDGVFPVNKPEQKRNISYDFVQIDYYPKLPEKKDLKIDSKLDNLGFVWLPSGITGWIKMDTKRYIVYQGMTSENTPQWFNVTDKNGIYDYVKNNNVGAFDRLYACLCAPLPGDIPLFMLLAPLHGTSNFIDYQTSIYWYSAVMASIKFAIMVFFNALFYSLLFGLFFSISGRRGKEKEFSFKTAFNTALYAGFPAIIIATLFTIAKMPWFEYQTMYIFALFIYLIIITNKNRNIKV